jgi:hypothetical protein
MDDIYRERHIGCIVLVDITGRALPNLDRVKVEWIAHNAIFFGYRLILHIF